ncbi:MAG: nuclear transport factor 2 family protein [Panacagrimonas sp.]
MTIVRHIATAALGCCLLGFSAYGLASPVSPGFKTATPQTDAQRAMLKVVQRWHDTYNTEVEKMILETYDKNADVFFTGASAHGHEQFMRLEKAIKTAAPGRYMRIDQIYFIGDDRTVVEAVILDSAKPDFFSPWCAILQIKDSKIVRDHTYLEPARWPGIESVTGIPTLGGLGVKKP